MRSRPVVLHVRSIAGHGGGPEKTILNSPRYLRKLGFESYCAYLHKPGEFEPLLARAKQTEAPLISVLDRGIWDWQVVGRLVRLCRELKPDIWHAHEYKSNLLGLIVRQFWPMKLVTTVHGWVSLQVRCQMYALLDKVLLPYYDAVIAVSDDTYRECLRVGVSKRRCHLVYNAIDLEEFSRRRTKQEARRLLGLPVHGLLVGAMGRLAEEKGFDRLIRAVARLVRQGHDLTLWIAGEGPLRGELQRLIGEVGCRDRVFLLGHISPPQPFFEALDIFVLSSRREGLPNVVLEAMAMEVPVIATPVAGVPMLVRNGKTGILLGGSTVAEFEAAIARLANSESLQRLYATNARQLVENRFDFARRMEKVCEAYRQVMSNGRSSRTRSFMANHLRAGL